MNWKHMIGTAVALSAMATSALASELSKGTEVKLVFDQPLHSKTAKAGERVKLHVLDNVKADGRVVIPRGTHVTALISQVQKNGRFGKNAVLKLTLEPVYEEGKHILLQPRQKGRIVGGKKTTEAAGLAGAGALLLGPLGLGAGYFVVGHSVNVKVGDKLDTEVSKTVYLK